MSDWREKLAGLSKELQAEEKAVADQKAAVLKGLRQRLEQLQPVLKNAQSFGDAFGVDVTFTISRFDDRYPFLELLIARPVLKYRLICKDGVIHERLQEGSAPAQEGLTTLEAISLKRFEARLNSWVQAAAQANRKVPGRRV